MKPALNDWVWEADIEVSIQPHHCEVEKPAAATWSGEPTGMPRKV